MSVSVGSLFAGYGGLDLTVASVFSGARTAWVADVDAGASAILAARFPAAPNLGDVTAVDWPRVPQVDVLTGGYPCQPESAAGKGLGTADERWLWPAMRAAARELRPRLVLGENVHAHVGRELRNVVADLQADGWAVAWTVVSAAEVGAPHLRRRVFWLAWPDTGRAPGGVPHALLRDGTWTVDGLLGPHPVEDWLEHGVASAGVAVALPAPTGRGGGGALLPTPRVSDTNGAGAHGGGGADLRTAVRELSDGGWGRYAPAVARWGAVLGRPAPPPVERPAPKGGVRLSARAVEWLMGLPAGWVTDVPGTSRTDHLRALGNGVVPLQGATGLARLLSHVPVDLAVGPRPAVRP